MLFKVPERELHVCICMCIYIYIFIYACIHIATHMSSNRQATGIPKRALVWRLRLASLRNQREALTDTASSPA